MVCRAAAMTVLPANQRRELKDELLVGRRFGENPIWKLSRPPITPAKQ